MKINTTLFIIIFLNTYINSQNNLWLYSPNVIIDFSSGEPEVRYDNSINIGNSEASLTLSDNLGKIVFYTEGENIFNKNFQLIENGNDIGGSWDSSQGILSVHNPNQPNIYDLFVTFESMYHIVIDISMNGGLGSVIFQEMIWENTSETITGFPNPCGGIWVITQDVNNENSFLSFLFDGKNIDYPVISQTRINSEILSYPPVQLKISSNGKILSYSKLNGLLAFYEFDAVNGEISNPFIHNDLELGTGQAYYTGSFSPNNNYYYTMKRSSTRDSIYYYQLDLSNLASSIISENLIGYIKIPRSDISYFNGSINIGPNEKIYMTHHPSHIIASIENPDNYWNTCEFNPERLVLEDLTGFFNFTRRNTISPIIEYFPPPISFIDHPDTTLCPTESLHLDYTTTPGTFLWSDGDTSRIKSFSQSGTYSLQITTPEGCEYMDTFSLDVLPPDVIQTDTLICDGGSVIRNNQLYYVGDTYTDTIYTDDCPMLNNISVKAIDPPFSTSLLPGDTSICEDSSLSLDLSHLPATFHWSDGSTDNFRLFTEEGNYALTITTEDGCIYTDTLLLSVISDETISLDTTLCPGELLVTPSDVYSSPGMYMDTSYQNDCPVITEIFLDIDSSALPSDTLFTTIPSGQSFTWYDQDYSDPGLYTYTYLNDNYCEVADYLLLSVEETIAGQLYLPNIISANDDGINDRFFIRSEDQDLISVASFHIYNRWGSVVHRQEGNIPLTDISWNGKSGNDVLPTGVYTYLIRLEADENRKEEVITGTITLIR